jgi:hypothetical protein
VKGRQEEGGDPRIPEPVLVEKIDELGFQALGAEERLQLAFCGGGKADRALGGGEEEHLRMAAAGGGERGERLGNKVLRGPCAGRDRGELGAHSGTAKKKELRF